MPFALALFYTRLMQFLDMIVCDLTTNCQRLKNRIPFFFSITNIYFYFIPIFRIN